MPHGLFLSASVPSDGSGGVHDRSGGVHDRSGGIRTGNVNATAGDAEAIEPFPAAPTDERQQEELRPTAREEHRRTLSGSLGSMLKSVGTSLRSLSGSSDGGKSRGSGNSGGSNRSRSNRSRSNRSSAGYNSDQEVSDDDDAHLGQEDDEENDKATHGRKLTSSEGDLVSAAGNATSPDDPFLSLRPTTHSRSNTAPAFTSTSPPVDIAMGRPVSVSAASASYGKSPTSASISQKSPSLMSQKSTSIFSRSSPSPSAYTVTAQATAISVAPIVDAHARRNADFHLLFRSVPENDALIDDYSAALQKDILVHGRMFVARNHVCFHANILGWITNAVISFHDILSIERKHTAFVIPNAIRITTLHATYVFASFINRETVYVLLVRLWRIAMGDDTIGQLVIAPPLSERSTSVYTEAGSEHSDGGSPIKGERRSHAGFSSTRESPSKARAATEDIGGHRNDGPETSRLKRVNTVAGGDVLTPLVPAQQGVAHSKKLTKHMSMPAGADGTKTSRRRASKSKHKHETQADDAQHSTIIAAIPTSIPRPAVYCNCTDHGPFILVDRVVKLPLRLAFTLLYGDPSGEFMHKFMGDALKYAAVTVPAWTSIAAGSERTFKYSVPYKTIFGSAPSFYPRIVTQRLVRFEPDDCFSIRDTITMPEIAGGHAFNVTIAQCLLYAGDGETRVLVGYGVEFTKSSWVKGIAERTAYDSNAAYWRLFEETLVRTVESGDPSKLIEGLRAKAQSLFARPSKETEGKPSVDKVPEPVISGKCTAEQPPSGAPWQTAVWSFIDNLGPLASTMALILALVNIALLIWIYHLNAHLDAVIHGDDVTLAAYRARAVADSVMPEWWFEDRGESMDDEYPTPRFENAMREHVTRRLSKIIADRHESTTSDSDVDDGERVKGEPIGQDPVDDILAPVLSAYDESLGETDASLSRVVAAVLAGDLDH